MHSWVHVSIHLNAEQFTDENCIERTTHLGSCCNGAALVERAILHTTLVDAFDNVEVTFVSPRSGPGVGNSPVLRKNLSQSNKITKP
jgi:hypothetical protein